MKDIFLKLISWKLHKLQNDLPFLTERMKIEKVERLVTNLHDKTEYIIGDLIGDSIGDLIRNKIADSIMKVSKISSKIIQKEMKKENLEKDLRLQN